MVYNRFMQIELQPRAANLGRERGELVVSPIDGTTKYLNVFPERFAPRRKAGAGERWTGPVPVLFPPGLGGSSAPRGCPDPWDTLCLQRYLLHCGSALLLPVLRC